MAWLAVNRNKDEVFCGAYEKPRKDFKEGVWHSPIAYENLIWDKVTILPKGTIRKLIKKDLTWRDEPVEI